MSVVGALGCSTLEPHTDSHGSIPALVAKSLATRVSTPQPTRIIAMSEAHIWAIDPRTGQEQWRRPLRANGQPAVSNALVIVPIRGQELVGLDLATGIDRWRIPLRGQALRGLAADDTTIIATSIADQAPWSSQLTAYSALDGHLRWSRRSRARLGRPAVLAGRIFIPFESGILVVSTARGRRLGTVQTPEFSPTQIIAYPGFILASSGEAIVDLFGTGHPYPLRTEFRPNDPWSSVIAPMRSHGLGFRLLPQAAGVPRDAVFLDRRTIIALRLDRHGRPASVRWVRAQIEPIEFIGMHVDGATLIAIREDATVMTFDLGTGRRLIGFEPEHQDEPLVGVAFAGGRPAAQPATPHQTSERALSRLSFLLDDPDPRLAPAQVLGLELLWRHPDPRVRDRVREIARDSAHPLAHEASTLTSGPMWGLADALSLSTLVEHLQWPGDLTEPEDWQRLAVEVVQAGGPAVFEPIKACLLAPETPAYGLEQLARTLRQLDDPAGVDAAAVFVGRYHADPFVAENSQALTEAARLLVRHIDHPRAKSTLQQVASNRFTVPQLRTLLETVGLSG